MHTARTALIWRAVFALTGWATLGLQYGLMLATPDRGVFELTLNFFSYFTILTNVLVALAMTLPVVAANRPLGRWAASEGVRASVAMYAVVVGLVYHFLLHATWNPQGWSLLANLGLHYLMPTAMLLDWLMFTPKGRLRWSDPAKWLVFPLVYGGWTVIHGLAADWWPYWFTDVSQLGWIRAGGYFGALLVFFGLVGLIVVAIDRTLGRWSVVAS
ncbi:MAG: Pr6Pr family membrane protein [Brevundimonas sp.]|nr:Pr6Pr family membrane protein [Brevundimonas sp.]